MNEKTSDVLSTSFRPIRASGFQMDSVDDDLMLFEVATGNVILMNATAAYVYECSDGDETVADIAAVLASHYSDAPGDVVTNDVLMATRHLVECGALRALVDPLASQRKV